ncbi:hypothetical protein J2Y56_001899 [Pseudomonas sp. BE134]|nr:hypothetical protein [Pseudomonas sp. BE134]
MGLLRSPAGASSLATVGDVLRVFRTLKCFFVAAVEQREAASDCEAVVIRQRMQVDRTHRACEDFILGRSLALLDSCYRG